VIQAAAQQDYEAFYKNEIENRKLMEQPPFADTFVFMVNGQTEHEVNKAALRIAATLQSAFCGEYKDLSTPVLGPVPAILARLNKRYRYQVAFRSKDTKRVRALVMAVLTAFQQAPESRTVTVTADKNPYTI
jgi:primosomal protein N' (replication factor Y)